MVASITPIGLPGTQPWTDSLAAAGDEELVALLRSRPELASPEPASLSALGRAVVEPTTVAAALRRLDRSARQALEAMCTREEPVSVGELAGALRCGVDELAPVLRRLAEQRLVLALSGDGSMGDAGSVDVMLLANPGLRGALRHPARLGRPLAALLRNKGAQELAELARRLGLAPTGDDKAALLGAISSALSDPAQLARTLAGAPAGTEPLARRLATGSPVLELGYSIPATQRATSERTPVGWLLHHGWAVQVSWGVAEMPAEVAIALRGGAIYPHYSPAAPTLSGAPVDEAAVDAEASRIALGAVATVMALGTALGEEPAKVLKEGGIGIREVRRLAKLVGRDETSTARLLELAGQAGLLAIDLRHHLVLPTGAFDDFSAAPAVQRWLVLAEGWLAAVTEIAVAGLEDLQGKIVAPLGGGAADPDAATRRRVLAEALAGAPPGRAIEAESLADLADWRRPALFAATYASARLLAGLHLAEAELLGIAVAGAPSSFGRALIAGDAGRAAELLATAAPPLVHELVLQADLTAIAAGELEAGVRSEMELLADVESSGAATVYRFGEASLRRGLDAGRTSGEILDFLRDHAPRGVPQALGYLVEDLGRRYGKVRVGSASSYVRVEDPAVVAELAGSRRLARLGLRSIAPTVLVSAAGPTELVDALRQAGYLAAGEEADGTLVVRRPAARRAPPSAPARGGRGRPAGRPRPGTSAYDRDEAQLRRLVAQLRAAPLRGLAGGRAAPGGTPQRGEAGAGPGGADLHGTPRPSPPAARSRPSFIAKDAEDVGQLLAIAAEHGWWVRLGWYDDRWDDQREAYALAMRLLDGRAVLELADGDRFPLGFEEIEWVRVATAAEEEANDLLFDELDDL